MRAVSATDKGARELNEDCLLVLSGDCAPCRTLGLLAVADGIGGRGSGATASRLALKTVADVFSAGCSVVESTLSDVPHLLRFAVQKANAAVYQAQEESESLRGMGATCVAAAVTSDSAHIVSVGDSRAYLYREGRLAQLTQDEWVKNARGMTLVHRAVGWQPVLPTEPLTFEVREGDLLLLCTDGLTDVVDDEAIGQVLASLDLHAACGKLVAMASAAPDADNATVVMALLERG